MNKNKSGFTLIELMVAMVIGVIILLGLISLFDSSSSLNRSQHGLSVLQENGRYAITRIKQDIELAGRKHCATVALPSTLTTDWDQGYQMTALMAAPNVTFNNGLPNIGDITLDSTASTDRNQLGDSSVPAGSAYPIDPSFFIKGHECSGTACDPQTSSLVGNGVDLLAPFDTLGSEDGNRPLQTDILTVRYFTGGRDVVAVDNASNTVTLAPNQPALFNGLGLIADCNNSLITTFNGAVANTSFPLPNLNTLSNLKLFDMNNDFRTVSYYLKLNTDPNDSNRLISSLYRSENGNEQQIVEGVERFDLFYLAQLQTGEVARLTADQVQAVSGGGDVDGDGAIDGSDGCTIPPRITSGLSGLGVANNPGCLWRSIYAVEVHMLFNTVNNSSTANDDRFIYSPDNDTPQDPSSGLASGLSGERMYRREFTAVVPVRSYTL